MRISIDASSLKKTISELERLRDGIPRAIAQGLNAGGDKVRTQVQHALQRQTGLKQYRSVTSRISTVGASESGAPKRGIGPVGPGRFSYTMYVRPKPTKPREFAVSVKKGKGGGVTVWLWNVPHQFKRSFQGSGHIAGQLRMREESTRTPTRGFDGPNLAKEVLKDSAKEAFETGAATLVLPQIVARLARLLR